MNQKDQLRRDFEPSDTFTIDMQSSDAPNVTEDVQMVPAFGSSEPLSFSEKARV